MSFFAASHASAEKSHAVHVAAGGASPMPTESA